MLKDIDWVKSALLFGMAACVLILLREWDAYTSERDALVAEQRAQIELSSDFPELIDEPTETTAYISTDNSTETFGDFPEAPTNSASSPESSPAVFNTTRVIQVQTDVLNIEIDPRGGDIISAKLLNHKISAKSDEPYTLLTSNSDRTYIARSGLLGQNGTDSANARPIFSSKQTTYQLAEHDDVLVVDLHLQQGLVQLTKRFRFSRNNYLIDVEYLINNQSNESWKAAFYAQINRDDSIPDAGGGIGMQAYVGAAITTPDSRYNKIDFDDIEDSRFKATVDSGWVALLERYFLSAWIPEEGKSVFYDLKKSSTSNLYFMGFTQPETLVAAGETGAIKTGFYVGPKDQYALRDIAQYLDLTVDYGWLWWAAQPLYAVLYFIQSGEIHSFNLDLEVFSGFSNWGVSIILLTLMVKLIFFPLSAASYKSMARMRKLTPKMTALKERLGGDKQALSQEMMKLYQKEKVNPVGGCLPMLLQMPIFLALYWVLLESVEIRQAPFAFWLQDLSSKDPWFILPLIMGASMWFQQRLNPAPPDPTQARIMQMMPIMFTVMFLFFPSGLVLYWTVNNILSIAQQWVITKNIESGKTE